MSFGVDHPLVAVADLDVAAKRAMALGFTLNPRHSHPLGTDNHLLFLHNNFIELIGIAQPVLTDYSDVNGFQFAKLIEARLALGEGVAMLALDSDAMERDHALVVERGFESHAPIEFRRMAHLSSGDVEGGQAIGERFEALRDLPSSPARAVALTLACSDIEAAIKHWQDYCLPFVRLTEHEADIPAEVLGGTLLRFSQPIA